MPTPHAPHLLGRHERDATAAAAVAAPELAPDEPPDAGRPAARGPRGDTRLDVAAVIRNASGRLRTVADQAIAEPLHAALGDLDAEFRGWPEAYGAGRATIDGTRRARAVHTIRACIIEQLRAPDHPFRPRVPLEVLADLALVVQLADLGSPAGPSASQVAERTGAAN